MRSLSSLNLNRGRRITMRRIGLAGTAGAISGLILFHAWLLVDRLRDLSILQPGVALQWLGTLLLLGFLVHLRRRKVSLVRGRSALAFWLLVLLLHLMPGGTAAPAAATNYELLLELPTTWLGISIALWLAVLLAVLLGSTMSAATRLRPSRSMHRDPGRLQLGYGRLFRVRPPPLASTAI